MWKGKGLVRRSRRDISQVHTAIIVVSRAPPPRLFAEIRLGKSVVPQEYVTLTVIRLRTGVAAASRTGY